MSSNNDSATSQPSSILFFIAVAIGVVIALVFIFFSMRYYVRTKLGIYATARLTTTNNNNSGNNNNNGIVLLTGDFPMHTFNAYQDINALRRRRRRRYLKKRRLTEEEVDHLFPVRTYQDWLDGGAERDADDREIYKEIREDDGTAENNGEGGSDNAGAIEITDVEPTDSTQDTNPKKEETTVDENTRDLEVTTSDQNSTYHDALPQPAAEVDLGTPYEPHYDSGTCAICIDVFEPEDQVRGLICGHVFHQDCLDPWLTKRKACCPMCKRDYYLKNEDGEGAEGEGNEVGEGDLDSLGFPELQYTTLNERVAEILERHPELEARAKEKVKRYLQFKWRIFWFVMGISRSDLIHSAVVDEDQRMRDEDPRWDDVSDNNNNNNNSSNNNETGNGETNGATGINPSNEANDSNGNNDYDLANRDRVERMV